MRWDECIPRPLAKGSPVRTYISSTSYLDNFILQEVCTLSLATEFAGDKMTTVNFFGLVLCLMRISVHVVTKATRGGWRNNSITSLMSGNLTSSRYKCQFLINIQSRNNQVKYHIFLSRQLGNTEWSAKNFCWPPGLLVDSLPSHVSLVHPFFFFWPYHNTFKPCYAGYPPMELKLRFQHRFFSFQTHIVQNWMDSRW